MFTEAYSKHAIVFVEFDFLQPRMGVGRQRVSYSS